MLQRKPTTLQSAPVIPTQKFALTCSMHLPDGRRVSGRIETNSPIRDASVRYSGAVNLLPFRCQAANTLVLRALFRSFAEDLKARYHEVMIEKASSTRRPSRSALARSQGRSPRKTSSARVRR